MIYELPNGKRIDTNRDLDFEERNFVQKMMIYAHLGQSAEELRARWRREGNPVWQGSETLNRPSPAASILIDLERKAKKRG